MTPEQSPEVTRLIERIQDTLAHNDLAGVAVELKPQQTEELVDALERLGAKDRAIAYRLLPKQTALEVFEDFDPSIQGELVNSLRDAEVAAIFEELDPDDRVWLLDELPASVAPKLLHGLSLEDRRLTASVLGYPKDSIGRRMSPEYVACREGATVGQAMARVKTRLDDAETIYTLPVLDDSRHVVGVVSLRDLLRENPETLIADVVSPTRVAEATEDEEEVARRLAEQGLLAMPITDSEDRLVGILTFDDAMRIIEHAESEDTARQGGSEPLRRPYLSTPTWAIVNSRIVWLLVLAVGAVLTVQVLSTAEATLAQVTALTLFVPLLIGTGGNTGNQAATTVTRALALGDVEPKDILKVLVKEFGVGMLLGGALGIIGFAVTSLIFEVQIGLIIGLTLPAICTWAATIGGIMPLIARAVHADPAVFSNPFITTFTDATGLIIYLAIARAILGI